MENGIQKAVRLAGTQTALATRLGISPQSVQKWVAQGYVPSGRCRAVESELAGAVTRKELNPAVFGDSLEASQTDPAVTLNRRHDDSIQAAHTN